MLRRRTRLPFIGFVLAICTAGLGVLLLEPTLSRALLWGIRQASAAPQSGTPVRTGANLEPSAALTSTINHQPSTLETLGVVPDSTVALSKYGGHPGVPIPPEARTGYFSKAQDPSGKWWLVDPDGNAFYSAGVSYVNPWGYESVSGTNPYKSVMYAKYGNPMNSAAWSTDAIDRLKSWGYNTAGPYAAESLFGKIPYTANLEPMRGRLQPKYRDNYPMLWEESQWDKDYRRYFIDVFHPEFRTEVRDYIADEIAYYGYAADRWLIGYLVDNELPFWYGRHSGGPWQSGNTMADVFIALPSTAYGKQEWIRELRERYHNNFQELNRAWGSGYGSFEELANATTVPPDAAGDKSRFLRAIFDKYFSTIRDAIRAADPNHMYLGSRFVVPPSVAGNPPELFDSVAANADVVSVNHYIWESMTYDQMKAEMDGVFGTVYRNKPLLATEYSFGATDSGMPCTVPNGAVVGTQAERAQLYASYRRASVDSPYIVGDFWWNYVDPPLNGNKWGNENCNLGLVDNSDRPYLGFLNSMANENRSIYTYRGLAPSTGPLISGLSWNVRSVGTAAATLQSTPQAASSPASPSPDFRLFMPLVFKLKPKYPAVFFTFSIPVAASSMKLDIHEWNRVQSALKRSITTDAAPAGRVTLVWDGADNAGQGVGPGSYYYVIKVVASDGRVDYATGVLTQ
ncbi:MAG: hypothetical protein HYY30_00300 [Chloroflexi bacterium]|nr:hypothetical protein [Chloroflexota bacterium]